MGHYPFGIFKIGPKKRSGRRFEKKKKKKKKRIITEKQTKTKERLRDLKIFLLDLKE